MNALKHHPFAVEAFFDHSLVLSYAYDAKLLHTLLPPYLEPDTWKEKWGFAALALVSTRQLRPKGFPKWMGRDFILAGIRIFVRYRDNRGKNLRGLYIIRSETNSRIMSFGGNRLTMYNYQTSDLTQTETNESLQFQSKKSCIYVRAQTNSGIVALPPGSPFANWADARRFAGPLPFTFSYIPGKKQMLIIEGVRSNWVPEPVTILHEEVKLPGILENHPRVLANAFLVSKVPYSWKKGRIETCTNK